MDLQVRQISPSSETPLRHHFGMLLSRMLDNLRQKIAASLSLSVHFSLSALVFVIDKSAATAARPLQYYDDMNL